MESTFQPTGLGYVYRLADEYNPDMLVIEVTDIRQRAGSIYALLTTSSTIPTARCIPGTRRVLHAEVWLLGERSRMDYAGALKRLIPAPQGARGLDFSAILEQIASLVIDHSNRPLDVQRLNGNITQQPTVYLVDGVLPARLPTILYGAGGVGKSILAAAMAMAVQSGVSILGHPVRQAEVLYLDWETDANDVGRRMHAAAAGLGITEPSLRYISLAQPLDQKISHLARYVAEENIGLAVIDSVGMAMAPGRQGGDPSETAIKFFGALRQMGTAVLAIDHISGEDMRRGGKGAGKPYGSIYKWNIVRNAFELRANGEPNLHGIHLLLKHRKTNIGPLLPTTAITLIWDDARGVATFGLDTSPVVVTPSVPLPEQITDILLVGPATPQKIADLLSEDGLTYAEMDVRRTLKELMRDGKVHAGPDGAVRMAQDGQDTLESPLLDT